MISPDQIVTYLEKHELKHGTMARKLGMTPSRFTRDVLVNGLTSQHEVDLFNLILKNDQAAEVFTIKEIDEFKELFGYTDYQMCLYLGLSTSTLTNMRTGSQTIPASVRKLFKALRLFHSEGYDINRYFGET